MRTVALGADGDGCTGCADGDGCTGCADVTTKDCFSSLLKKKWSDARARGMIEMKDQQD